MESCYFTPCHIDRAQKCLIINGVTRRKKLFLLYVSLSVWPNMRHAHLKPVWGSSISRFCQQLDKFTTNTQTGVPVIPSVYLICEEFTYLNHYSPASCTSSDVNVWPLRAFFNGPLQDNKSRLYAGCLSTSHYTVFSSEICGPRWVGHCPAAGWCHVISKFTWTFILDLGMMILKYLPVMVCTDHVVNVIQIPEA